MQKMNSFVTTEQVPDLISSTSIIQTKELTWIIYSSCYSVVGPCAKKPCQNGGICTETGNNSRSCQCAVGYSGENCEKSTYRHIDCKLCGNILCNMRYFFLPFIFFFLQRLYYDLLDIVLCKLWLCDGAFLQWKTISKFSKTHFLIIPINDIHSE